MTIVSTIRTGIVAFQHFIDDRIFSQSFEIFEFLVDLIGPGGCIGKVAFAKERNFAAVLILFILKQPENSCLISGEKQGLLGRCVCANWKIGAEKVVKSVRAHSLPSPPPKKRP